MQLKEWNSLTIQEKLNITKEKLNISTDDDLIKILKVSKKTLFNWKTGATKPSRKVLHRLFNICQVPSWGSELYGKDSFIAQYTIAYDQVKHMYIDMIDSDDNLIKSNAIHSVNSKIAECITQRFKLQDSLIPIIHVHSIYGSSDYGEIMNITAVNKEGSYVGYTVDVCVKIGEVGDSLDVVYIVECVNSKGIVEQRKGGRVSDYAISTIVSLVVNYLNKS